MRTFHYYVNPGKHNFLGINQKVSKIVNGKNVGGKNYKPRQQSGQNRE